MRGYLYTSAVCPSHSAIVRVIALVCLLLLPGLASADVGEGAITRIIDWALAIALPLATLGVIFLGFRAWVGEISWRPVGMFVIGCVCVFGAAEIAAYFTSGT